MEIINKYNNEIEELPKNSKFFKELDVFIKETLYKYKVQKYYYWLCKYNLKESSLCYYRYNNEEDVFEGFDDELNWHCGDKSIYYGGYFYYHIFYFVFKSNYSDTNNFKKYLSENEYYGNKITKKDIYN